MASAKSQIHHVADKVQHKGQEALGESQEWLEHADDMIRDAMREHPAACLFAALAFGYAIGRLVARR